MYKALAVLEPFKRIFFFLLSLNLVFSVLQGKDIRVLAFGKKTNLGRT
jgi:hypothetical protein